MTQPSTQPGALAGIKVLDLSRVLAGPWCTQMLADLGADVIKIERPVVGDDTRHWGPPFLQDEHGNNTEQASYYAACNRNKRSITIDMAQAQGQALIRQIADENNFSIRQLYQWVASARGHFTIVGTAVQIADTLQEWFENEAADGFNILPPWLPTGLNDFVDLVIPELQRRELFRTAYEGRTLRENLGLPFPLNRWTVDPSVVQAAE